MELNNKTIELMKDSKIFEDTLRFGYRGFFIDFARDNWEQILTVNTAPVINYHNTIVSTEMPLLINLYRILKYYLSQKSFYPEAMQEGVALLVSKVSILEKYRSSMVDYYFKVGDRSINRDVTNPFEEITRLLLLVAKEEFIRYGEDNDFSLEKITFEHRSYLDVAEKAINGFELYESTYLNCDWQSVVRMFNDLDNSTLSSDIASLAFSRENKNLIIGQFDMIATIYQDKLYRQLSAYDTIHRLLTENLSNQFNNSLTNARRNIGVYAKTKTKIDN